MILQYTLFNQYCFNSAETAGDQTVEGKTEKKGTFIVQILNVQNDSWQGTVTWTEKKETMPFRSALELLRLIDSALEDERPLDEK